jgi:hypothetical protein
MLERLSKNYMLFLSTGNYTEFATKKLKEGGVYDAFAHIQGSELITKSPQHIDIFKEIAMDPEFEFYALSIGDGDIEK